MTTLSFTSSLHPECFVFVCFILFFLPVMNILIIWSVAMKYPTFFVCIFTAIGVLVDSLSSPAVVGIGRCGRGGYDHARSSSSSITAGTSTTAVMTSIIMNNDMIRQQRRQQQCRSWSYSWDPLYSVIRNSAVTEQTMDDVAKTKDDSLVQSKSEESMNDDASTSLSSQLFSLEEDDSDSSRRRFRNTEVNGYTMLDGSNRYRNSLEGLPRHQGPQWYQKLLKKINSLRRGHRGGAGGFNTNQKEEDDDGYADMQFTSDEILHQSSLWGKLIRYPVQLFSNILHTAEPKGEPGTLILVRHGESLWNANKTFTGWADPDMSPQGYREAEYAARLLLEGGYEIDLVMCSRLKRSIRSTWIILQEMNQVYLPVFKSWRLNERCYGALTGLSKSETAKKLGVELVQEWRGSLTSRPPPMKVSDPLWPGRDRRYADLSEEQIPLTESLLDCMVRTTPLWEQKIVHELRKGRNVMVVAHGNTLRGLVKTIDSISDEDIKEVAIPTGIPIVYKFDKQLKPIPPSPDKQSVVQLHMNGVFLEKPGLLNEALKREEEWSKKVPGYNPTMQTKETPMSSLERSLYKLRAERELGKWAGQFVDRNAPPEDDGNDGNRGRPIQFIEDEVQVAGLQKDPVTLQAAITSVPLEAETEVVANVITNHPCVATIPREAILPGIGNVPVRRDPVIVIIRHGKTEHNKLKLFTGWEDAPLAPEGIEEAKEAGRLLKKYGFEFDVVYTSWLSRAIETAWFVMSEMDCLWLPIIKTWRLNERMYGELTGLSKQMVKQRHGEAQFKAWRRGYDTPPPAVSSFSQHYPGNDIRYEKYLNDVPFSWRESMIRSIERGRLVLSRRFPKTESLKDCMDRTVPYFTECIWPEAVAQGKRVLISSSENAIRGLLMHLCEIPKEEITGLEIPNGLPLIFDVRSKCVKLLDDGTGRDPLEVYDFGKAANYLFRPCENEDGTPDEECKIFLDNEVDNNDPSSKESTTNLIQLTKEEQMMINAIKTRPTTTAFQATKAR